LACLVLASPLYAQTAKKALDKSFAGKAEVHFQQNRGPLQILPSTDGKIRIVTEMSVEAQSREEGDRFLAKMEADFIESTNRLEIKIGSGKIRNWTMNNNNSRVTFQDGSKFRNIHNFKMNSTLYLPATEMLSLETRFERVRIEPQVELNNLKLELHNVDLTGGDVKGNLEFDARFGKIELGNVDGELRGVLHNVRFEIGDAGNVRLDTRFSEIEMGKINALEVESHNDRVEVVSVSGELDIHDRFGTYIIGTTVNGEIETHNGTFEIEKGGDYEVNSRFGNFEFNTLDQLDLQDNHNAEYEIKRLRNVEGDGRFTTIDVEVLTGEADLELGNGKLRVDDVTKDFKGVEVEGSFFEVDLEFASPVDYHVQANMQFGSVHPPKDIITVIDRKEHSHLEMELKTANATASSPIIKVRGNNGKLYLD
ncbi:MAG: hypothetical protein AAFU67_11310, partial [Bacteroidota bacterium]